MADPSHRERGLRAAIHNPRVSEQAKQHDRELLASEFGEQVEEQVEEHAAPSSGRKPRRASSGDPGPEHHMAEEKDPAKV